MGIIIDVVIISFIALTVFLGYKKGLVNLGIRLCSFFIAIVITFILYRPIANFVIDYTQIDEAIEKVIMNKKEISNSEDIIEKTYDQVLTQIARPLACNIVYGGIMFLLFIITKIILFFITSLTSFITNLPIIHQFDKAGGVLYGIIISFFIISLILLVISFISKVNPNNIVHKEIENSFITKLLYENNILQIFFQ